MNILKKMLNFPTVEKSKPEVLKSLLVLPKDETIDKPKEMRPRLRGCNCGKK